MVSTDEKLCFKLSVSDYMYISCCQNDDVFTTPPHSTRPTTKQCIRSFCWCIPSTNSTGGPCKHTLFIFVCRSFICVYVHIYIYIYAFESNRIEIAKIHMHIMCAAKAYASSKWINMLIFMFAATIVSFLFLRKAIYNRKLKNNRTRVYNDTHTHTNKNIHTISN